MIYINYYDESVSSVSSVFNWLVWSFCASKIWLIDSVLLSTLSLRVFTFDDSSIRDSDENATPDFSMTLETMDNEIFTRRVTDSAF